MPLAVVLLLAGVLLGNAKLVDHPLSRVHRAERLVENQEYALALDEIRQAVESAPFLGRAYYVRGRVLAELGDARGAVSELSRALQLGLDSEDQREAISLMLDLRSRP